MKRLLILFYIIYAIPVFAQTTFDDNKQSCYLKEMIRVPSPARQKRSRIVREKVCVLMTIENNACIQDVANDYGCEMSVLDSSTDEPLSAPLILTIYALDGRKVACRKGHSINLSALPSGVYAVQVESTRKDLCSSTIIRL